MNGRAATGWYIDEIIFRGTEKITRDLAMTDLTVREEGFIVKSKSDDLQREINATVLNAGEASWTDLPVIFSAPNRQGEDLTTRPRRTCSCSSVRLDPTHTLSRPRCWRYVPTSSLGTTA